MWVACYVRLSFMGKALGGFPRSADRREEGELAYKHVVAPPDYRVMAARRALSSTSGLTTLMGAPAP